MPSAVVAGAVAPDVPYYVSLQWLGGDYNLTLTHDATSVLWLDPLIALALLLAFHALKRPLATLLPDAAAVLLSVVGGAASHVGWDALCDAFGIAWSTRLNLASDLVGGLALVTGLALFWRRTSSAPALPDRPLAAGHRRVLVGAAAVVVVGWTSWATTVSTRQVSADLHAYDEWTRSAVLEHAVREAAVQAGTALGGVLLVLAVALVLPRSRRGRPPLREPELTLGRTT